MAGAQCRPQYLDPARLSLPPVPAAPKLLIATARDYGADIVAAYMRHVLANAEEFGPPPGRCAR